MSDGIIEEKAALRARMRAQRRSHDPLVLQQAGQHAAVLLLDFLRARLPAVAALYSPLPGEIDTRVLDAALRAQEVRIAYPRVAGPRRLTLHLAAPAELRPGAFGVCEPAADAPPVLPSELGLIVAPGLAFDRHGRRLGFGGGYYDALFAAAPQALRCGVFFSFQQVAQAPVEPHDGLLDVVIDVEKASLLVTHARATVSTPPPSRGSLLEETP